MEVVGKKSDLCVLSLETNVKYNIHVLALETNVKYNMHALFYPPSI